MKKNNCGLAPLCYIRIGDDKCTGCAACSNGCKQSAIKIVLNREGFYRPILIKNRCNECGACLAYCPVFSIKTSDQSSLATLDYPEVYAAWSNDKDIHLSSSSGGVFSELARQVLENSGVVCGCEWGEDWAPRHVLVRDFASVVSLRGSKYVPSYVGESFYNQILDIAVSGTLVLFCGTPCQVAGLACIAPPRARKNLILVDLVCHGVPSLTSFWSYLEWKFGSKVNISYFSFRNKEVSVKTICAIDMQGNKYLATAGSDPWFRSAMVYNFFLQRCCFDCRFGSLPRNSDITIGDFWGIPDEWRDPKGDSVILINTEKGKKVISSLVKLNRIRTKKSDFSTTTNRRLRGVSYPVSIFRKISFNILSYCKSFSVFYYLCYLPIKFFERVVVKLRRFLY